MRCSVLPFLSLCAGHICFRGRLGLPFHDGVGISTVDTKHEVVLFPSVFERRGYPTAEHIETPDGVDDIAVAAARVSYVGSLLYSDSYSRAQSGLAQHL